MAESRFSTGRRHVNNVLIQAGNRVHTAHPVKIARFPDECISLRFCVRRHPDRAPSRAHSIVHPPDAARSIVVIQKRSLNQFRSCVARRSGDIVAGVGATRAVLAHSSLLVPEVSRIFGRDPFVFGSLSTCCEAPLARARLKPSGQHPTNE